MEDALGIRFDARDGERLFRSTLVQTLFYGLFSAWVVHARAGKQNFDWRVSQWSLHVPVMRLLFGQIATPQALEPLGLVPLLDAAEPRWSAWSGRPSSQRSATSMRFSTSMSHS
jgi:hypothetical protein